VLDIDEKTHSLVRTSMAKICVEMNLRDGFSKGTDIQVGNHSYHQEKDYVKIPFRSSNCHMHGCLK
jgi:hypothetical protein